LRSDADLQPSYILHSRAYRETSIILEVYGADIGRIAVLAYKNKTNRALLQPFVPLLLSWRGRGEMPTLRQCEMAGRPCVLKPIELASSLYLNELMIRLLPHRDPHRDLFELYQATLMSLEAGLGVAKALRIFEKHLLRILGYGLTLMEDIEGEVIVADHYYSYDFEQGAILMDARAQFNQETIFKGASLLALEREDLNDPFILREIKRLMRQALARHLGIKPLMSRQLLCH